MSLDRRTGLRAMSDKRRQELADAGNTNPYSTILNTGVGLSSTAAAIDVKPVPKQRRPKPAVPAEVRDALIARAGGLCEIRRAGCRIQGTDPSHRITQKSGGRHGEAKVRHDRLSNVMWACRPCHDWVGNNPAAAKAEYVGWALEEWQAPAACPALYRGRLVLLSDDGLTTTYTPNHTNQEVSA